MKRVFNFFALTLILVVSGCERQEPVAEHVVVQRLECRDARGEVDVAIRLGAPGQFFVNEENVSLEELSQELAKLAKINRDAAVTLEAQDESLGREFVAVLDLIKENGFSEVTIEGLGGYGAGEATSPEE